MFIVSIEIHLNLVYNVAVEVETVAAANRKKGYIDMNELMNYVLSLTPEQIEKVIRNIDKIKAVLKTTGEIENAVA